MARTCQFAKMRRKPKFKTRVRNRCRICGRPRGYLRKFQMCRICLKYTPDKRSAITGLRRVSKPGSRRYVAVLEIRPIMGGLGINILTTPRGVMTGRSARKARVGGEVLCEVW